MVVVVSKPGLRITSGFLFCFLSTSKIGRFNKSIRMLCGPAFNSFFVGRTASLKLPRSNN